MLVRFIYIVGFIAISTVFGGGLYVQAMRISAEYNQPQIAAPWLAKNEPGSKQ